MDLIILYIVFGLPLGSECSYSKCLSTPFTIERLPKDENDSETLPSVSLSHVPGEKGRSGASLNTALPSQHRCAAASLLEMSEKTVVVVTGCSKGGIGTCA